MGLSQRHGLGEEVGWRTIEGCVCEVCWGGGQEGGGVAVILVRGTESKPRVGLWGLARRAF